MDADGRDRIVANEGGGHVVIIAVVVVVIVVVVVLFLLDLIGPTRRVRQTRAG
jgi:uncharacterized membrane protein